MRLITDTEEGGYGQETGGIPVGTRVWIGPLAGSMVANKWGAIIREEIHPYGVKYGRTYLVQVRTDFGLKEVWIIPQDLYASELKPFAGAAETEEIG